MFESIRNRWTRVKAFFNRSWSIFLARLDAFTGLILVAVSSLDLSPIIGGIQTGVNWTYVAITGGVLMIKGILTEVGRRQGTVTLSDGQLMPSNVSEKVEALKVIAPTKADAKNMAKAATKEANKK